MKLKNKIQNSMTLVVMTTLLIAYVITTFVVYRQTLDLMENEIHQEADYIKTAIEKTGESYLKEMDDVRRTTRVTLIARDGTVLYDSGENAIER
jgi:two-component system, OmpR family, phosphate regulon sensor histidine kinase PhoR